MRYLILLLLLGFSYSTQAAASECIYPENALVVALQDKSDWPERTHHILKGDDLANFLSNLMLAGYLTGTLYDIDTVYVIDAQVLPEATEPMVWLFFVSKGCIITRLPASKAPIEEALHD